MIDLLALRILLVEDNELDRRMMLHYLADYDPTAFEVVAVGSLGEAAEALDSDVFDCVLLDLSLPDSEGLASIDALMTRSAKAPIVVLTGLEDPAVAVRAVERGAQDYLTKQRVDPELVGRSIRYAVARHHSETQLRFAHERLDLLEERERIARDLHDTVIQQLFATGMSLQSLGARLGDADHQRRIDEAVEGIDQGIRQLREAIFGLHHGPTAETVASTIVEVAESQRSSLGFRPSVRVSSSVDDLDETLAHDLLATIREGLSNVAKHAGATAAQVLVDLEGGDVVLRIVDNGRGLPAVPESPVARLTGRGLENMRRRASEQSGRFTIGPAPGGGTELVWRAPARRGL